MLVDQSNDDNLFSHFRTVDTVHIDCYPYRLCESMNLSVTERKKNLMTKKNIDCNEHKN